MNIFAHEAYSEFPVVERALDVRLIRLPVEALLADSEEEAASLDLIKFDFWLKVLRRAFLGMLWGFLLAQGGHSISFLIHWRVLHAAPIICRGAPIVIYRADLRIANAVRGP